MGNDYAENAKKLKDKYVAENAVLASWRDELISPSVGSPEANLVKDWRGGWIGYMNVVIDIGDEKIAALQAIVDATSNEEAAKLVADLKGDYERECNHYSELAEQSSKVKTRTTENLARLLNLEARDRADYSDDF